MLSHCSLNQVAILPGPGSARSHYSKIASDTVPPIDAKMLLNIIAPRQKPGYRKIPQIFLARCRGSGNPGTNINWQSGGL
jgi:hypothetical protein